MIKRQKIVLEITYNAHAPYVGGMGPVPEEADLLNPADWAWNSLLDLGPDEDCRVVEVLSTEVLGSLDM